ncbi:MAG: type II toxin-antitoxin system VapC family toxin [Thermoflexales bacterium]
MKNVVDSSGWLEYFAGGANASFFAPPIHAADRLIVPAICIYEVFKRVLIQAGEEEALRIAGIMSMATVAPLDRDVALEAARVALEHKLALADSVILATTQLHDATLWTQDEHFNGIAGVKFIHKAPGALR